MRDSCRRRQNTPPPDELIKHLFNGSQLPTKTRPARTTGTLEDELGETKARESIWEAHARAGCAPDKRPSLEAALAARYKEKATCLLIQSERESPTRRAARPQ